MKKVVVPRPEVFPKLNDSSAVSCSSDRQPLTLCFWEHSNRTNLDRDAKVVYVVDGGEVIANQGTGIAGRFYAKSGFAQGNCELKIEWF